MFRCVENGCSKDFETIKTELSFQMKRHVFAIFFTKTEAPIAEIAEILNLSNLSPFKYICCKHSSIVILFEGSYSSILYRRSTPSEGMGSTR